jgi:hypothetical protein
MTRSLHEEGPMTTPRTFYLLGLALAALTALFLFWAIGALGIIGEGGEPDRMYLAVFATLLAGSLLARLRPRGMAYALLATAASVGAVAGVALARGLQDTPGASAVEILGLTGMYMALFGASAWCFWRAAEARDPATR